MSKDVIILDSTGKSRAWHIYLGRSGVESVVVATSGHVCSFAPRLFPIGISWSGAKIDFGRVVDEQKKERIVSALDQAGASGRVIIATDKDVEGDVIALDVINIIAETHPHLISRCLRAHAKSLTVADIAEAVDTAISVKAGYQKIVSDAIEGRARAVTDRWIGAALSKSANTPIGRIRSAIPGMALLHQVRPESLRGAVEVGEIVMMSRSSAGGLPFTVRIPLMSNGQGVRERRLSALARKFANRLLPGAVRPVSSLSAAVADRFLDVRPYNTGDAVAHACRHYALRPHEAMQGLTRAYYRGDISYPKTDSRTLTPQSAAKVARLGASCEIYGLSAADAVEMDRSARVHEGLHPVCEPNLEKVNRLRILIRKDWTSIFHAETKTEDISLDMTADLMTAIVSRRAFEAAKSARVERGFWRPGNDLLASDISHEDFDLLEDLEWQRETGPVLPWTRHMTTMVRVWPRESVLMDMMMTEELGRPSSLPSLLKTVTASGDVDVSPVPPREGNIVLPALTAQGRENLRKMPKNIWDPAAGRTIAQALANDDESSGETAQDTIDTRIRKRIGVWFEKMQPTVKQPLLASIERS